MELRRIDDTDDDDAATGAVQNYAARIALSDERRQQRALARQARAVQAETEWLLGTGPEPAWPEFPGPRLRAGRRGLRARRQAKQGLGQGAATDGVASAPARPEFIVDKTVATLWLQIAGALLLPEAPDELRRLLDHFWPWTAQANGVGTNDQDLVERSSEMRLGWNAAYFGLLVKHGVVSDPPTIGECLQRAGELPVDGFLAAAAAMLRHVDQLWLRNGSVDEGFVRQLREGVIDRVESTWEWQGLVRQVSDRATLPQADLIAALFFGEHELGKGPKCLLTPLGMAQAGVFLPLLADLAARSARSMVVAAAFLRLVEVDPKWEHLPQLGRVHAAWCAAYGTDRRFWDGFGAAHRLCAWIVGAIDDATASPTATSPGGRDFGADPALVTMLDNLVRVGSPAAQQLERRLGIHRSDGSGSR